MSGGKSLTRREFDEVIRRAAELSADDPDGGEPALAEEDLFRISSEVGLSEAHVRRALAEVRGEALVEEQESSFFEGAIVHASRTVPGGLTKVGKQLDDFLIEDSLLRSVRVANTLRTYKPASDTASELARAFGQRHFMATAKEVEVAFDEVSENATHVRLSVDPGARKEYVKGAWFAGLGVSGGLAIGGVAVAGGLGLPVLAGGALGVAAGGVLGWVSVLGVRGAWRRKRKEIHEEVEVILDKLETGQSLRPPPPRWQSWIQSQLKGIGLIPKRGDEQ